MTRKEFTKMCSLLGLSIPFQSVMASCDITSNPVSERTFDGSVLVIGAGAAGLTAAYLLKQKGIDVQVLEANSYYGGRMIRNTDFADFPIPLGAEWLHVEPGIFDDIVNNNSVQVNINTTPYKNDDYALYEGMQISMRDVGFTIDQKFVNSTWFDFFKEYIVPSVQSAIAFNKVVQSIDYSGERVIVSTSNDTFSADKIIVTVPVKILQSGMVTFTPQLPKNKVDAINAVNVWDGCKAFIEFSEKFYPAAVAFNIPEAEGQKLYYDAAYGQNTSKNILGLFAVGTGTLPYVNLSDDDLIAYMLNELDGIFDGKASANYVKHLFQNWNAAPYANGAYVSDEENWRNVRTLGEYVGNKLFFAGCTYTTGEDWSSVHTAGRSAIRAVNALIG